MDAARGAARRESSPLGTPDPFVMHPFHPPRHHISSPKQSPEDPNTPQKEKPMADKKRGDHPQYEAHHRQNRSEQPEVSLHAQFSLIAHNYNHLPIQTALTAMAKLVAATDSSLLLYTEGISYDR